MLRAALVRLTVAGWLLTVGNVLVAQDEPVTGKLTIGGNTYTMTQIVAFPSTADDERRVTIVVSDRKLPSAAIKAASEGGDLELTQPYVRLVFEESGSLESCRAWADNSVFSGVSGSKLKGKMDLADGRVTGQAALNFEGIQGPIRFDLRFNVPFGNTAPSTSPVAATGPVQPSVTGKFLGNGKEAKLAFVSARRGEPFNDKPSIVLVFSEKDHLQDPKPDFKASFGEYGSAVVLNVYDDGSIFGCQIVHTAHERSGFSTSGNIRSAAFDVEAGRIQGEFTTGGEKEFFGDTWELDIKFVAPFADSKSPSKPEPTTDLADKPQRRAKRDSAPAKKSSGAAANVSELPLPEDASAVEFKKLVQQIVFRSGGDVPTVAKGFLKGLVDQGWKSSGAELVTPNSAILNVSRGDATLTVMIKPDGSGSKTTIFAKGMEW